MSTAWSGVQGLSSRDIGPAMAPGLPGTLVPWVRALVLCGRTSRRRVLVAGIRSREVVRETVRGAGRIRHDVVDAGRGRRPAGTQDQLGVGGAVEHLVPDGGAGVGDFEGLRERAGRPVGQSGRTTSVYFRRVGGRCGGRRRRLARHRLVAGCSRATACTLSSTGAGSMHGRRSGPGSSRNGTAECSERHHAMCPVAVVRTESTQVGL